ncbi:MAG: oligoendopeptidase F [Selenomonadaceae bacterium]
MDNFFSVATNATSTGDLISRSEVDPAHKWQLKDIFPDDQAFEAEFSALQQLLSEFDTYKGKLREPASLLACLTLRDTANRKAGSLFAYARMHRDVDTADSSYQALTARTTTLLSKVATAQAFIDPELLALDAAVLRQTIKADPAFAPYDFVISDLLRQKSHVLSPAEEELLAQAGEICQSPANIFTIMTNADLKFPQTSTDSGEKVQLTEGRYNNLIRSTNRLVRKEAFHNLFTTYAAFRNTFAAAYSSQVQSTLFRAKARKYSSSQEAALDSGNIPLSVYDHLITGIRSQLPLLHRYTALKKRILGLDEMHMYDLYVPLAAKLKRSFSYEEGLSLVTAALHPLGSDYKEGLLTAQKNSWIDIYENKGKRSGAYSWGVYGVHPFVLLNYDNRYESVSTLAHELGHAMHSHYSNQAQPYATASYTIFCAEVASTTNENLLLDYMLATVSDPAERLYFLNQYLEQVRTTVYRQTMFAEFEKTVHSMVQDGLALTADALESIWLDLNRAYYGEDILVDDALKIEWARIPHFYRPFYVYQYATGYAAATALAEQLSHGDTMAQKSYLAYLASGGSDYSLPLLQRAGVDMTSPTPLATTLEKFAARLAEFELLLTKTAALT